MLGRKTVDVRAKIVYWARWGVKNTAQIHYREARPMPLSAALPLTTDCSGFVTLCYKLAGAPDPNGLGYNGAGYTGTLLGHGQHIPLAQVQPGDVVVYGPGTGWHTALIVGVWPDAMAVSHACTVEDPVLTVSHGWEGAPEYVRVSQDGRKPQTYLRFPTTVVELAAHIPASAVPPAKQPQPPAKKAGTSPAHTGAIAKKAQPASSTSAVTKKRAV